MKKLIATLITCTFVVFAISYLTRSDSLKEKIINWIQLEEIQEDELNNKNTNYWYKTLNEDEKQIYRIIANGVMNLDNDITVKYTKENSFESNKQIVEKVLNAFFADNPDVFYIKDKYEISVTNILVLNKIDLKLEYISNDIEEIERMNKELNSEVERINSQISMCETIYEKELLIHDILAKEITYFEHESYDEIPSIKHTSYSALVDKSAVCDGITKAFQLILSKNNIESVFVTGISENVPHAWCKVRLDGVYYNVDVTSDKALNKENKNLVIHSCFNITDEEIMKTHEFDNYDRLPKSEENKYNYYMYNDCVITLGDDFQNKLGQIIQKQKKSNLLEFKANGINNVPSKIVEALYNLDFNNYKARKITKIEYNQINDNYIVVK